MPKHQPPQGFPARLLRDAMMVEACRQRDFATIFQMAKRAGIYPSLIARLCEMSPSRVGEVAKGQREVKDMQVIERLADGLRIPGHMLGLARRDWEPDGDGFPTATAGTATAPDPGAGLFDDSADAGPVDNTTDPEFAATLIEGQLPQHYQTANYFGARHSIPSVVQHAQNISRLLETATGPTRQTLLRTGGQVAEFIGWLYQDLGDFRSAALWSDRSMEWAQEAADDHMQAYLLFRKSNQATAQASAQKAVGLAKAAQRLPGLTPQLTALAAQQEAQGYALMRNERAAFARFDEACELAAEAATAGTDATVDTSYCTPTYIEIQRANCWIDLGQPQRAIKLFEGQLAALPQVYRNDRSVYLARLARAYVTAGEPESGADAAIKALAIVRHTGSARTFSELASVAGSLLPHRVLPKVAAFIDHFEIIRDRFAA
ncbi:hypothetical protein ACFP1Z_08590 [Streptomyces gamaensis]|uniref:XRE family transcriptional regulator n=1 Tax=Streptomyces gamaensis TaxID=1763542 RepID=A0ABW0YZU5_9ACTN